MGISENKPDLNDHSSPVNDLGLMGGMFDPVHFGHLNLAENVLRQLSLDELHFVPCGIPSHRGSLVAPSEHRLAMLELAIGDEKRFRVDDRNVSPAKPPTALTPWLQCAKRDRTAACIS